MNQIRGKIASTMLIDDAVNASIHNSAIHEIQIRIKSNTGRLQKLHSKLNQSWHPKPAQKIDLRRRIKYVERKLSKLKAQLIILGGSYG